ncbi:MAG TPA: radical SAM protein [Anaerovoracaceae bacterium]|nr:radical SAM protein [Anaerovoracaceae bacterium]
MKTNQELEQYLSNGVDNIVKGIMRASFINPQAAMFMARYAVSSKKAKAKRAAAENEGKHIPPFLIASITHQCNLHCKGCYARANNSCTDACGHSELDGLLTENEWSNVFRQASDMGIEFILLAGGEPFVRKDVITEAGCHSNILFPIFTNGTMIDQDYMHILEKNRNLLPVISIEGNEKTTDARRGQGVYQTLQETMAELHRRGIIFGASVTVTKANMQEVMAEDFIETLKNAGAKAIIYVEYVPVDKNTEVLALDDESRDEMMTRLDQVREAVPEMVFIAFPGDEKTSGGCLAAGRGFFHINARGGAEPCPFSPYSDTNIKNVSLMDALQSPLFRALQDGGALVAEHTGGCVLFEQQEQVEAILKEKTA